MAENGISGTAVAVATFGAVFVYAGFRGVSPLQALRDATSGKPPAVEGKPTTVTPSTPGLPSGFADPRRAQVVAAAQKYVNDQYSQLNRALPGWSDCSSFVDKALKDVGINPPFSPWASTANYRMSPDWPVIEQSAVRPGDIAISSSHMVLVTADGGTSGIGQQRPGVNVRTGSMATLFGSQRYHFRTWKGYSRPSTGAGGGGGGGGSW